MPAPSAGLEQQQVQDRSDTAAAAILRAGRLIWAIGVTLIVITLLGCGVTIWDLHDETIEQQRLAVRNLGFVLAEQTARYVQVVDLVLQEIQSRSATLVASSPDRLPQTFGAEQTRDFLRDRLKNLPQANAFFLLNSDGRTVVTSRVTAGGNLDFSGRDYYRHFIEQNDPNPFISSPMNSRVVGTPTVYLARRINALNHTLIGVAVGAIDLQYITDFYRAIELPRRRDRDICCVAMGLCWRAIPIPPMRSAKRMAANSPWHQLVAGQGGTYRSPGFLGPRTGRRVGAPAAHLAARHRCLDDGTGGAGEMARPGRGIAAGGIAASCGFAVLFGVIGLQFRRKAEQNARLATTAAALRASEARVLDFAGMSSDWLWELDA